MFGKRRDYMSQESREIKGSCESEQDKLSPSVSQSKNVRREVELFPPIAEKNASSPPSVPTGAQLSRLSSQISMFQPVSFEEALNVVAALRSRSATTISLEKLKKSDAGRLVDFVAGASAALDGDFHKMTEQVYLFCPATMKIVVPEKQDNTNKSSSMKTTSALANTTSKNSSSFSLDTLFPDFGQQDKYQDSFSSFFNKQ